MKLAIFTLNAEAVCIQVEGSGRTFFPIVFILLSQDNFILGLIGQLKPDVFSLLMKLQNKMAVVIKSVGNIEQDSYPLDLLREGGVEGIRGRKDDFCITYTIRLCIIISLKLKRSNVFQHSDCSTNVCSSILLK